MRQLKNREIWNAVRQHSDKERVNRIFAPFKEAGEYIREHRIKNPFDLPAELMERMIFSQVESVAINGCKCSKDTSAFFSEVTEIGRRIFGVTGRSSLKSGPKAIIKHYWKIYSLGRSYAKEQKCHISRPFVVCWGERFICYCDEHEH